jgi:small conductance mechanosensitive channel
VSGWEFAFKQNIIGDLLKIAAIFIVIRILVQLIYILFDHFFKITKENNNLSVDHNLLQNIRSLVKTVLVYGGYFLAAIFALEILQVQFLDAQELKNYGLKLLKAILIIIGARLILKLGWAVIDHLFLEQEEGNLLARHRRAGTLRALLRSGLMYVVYFIAGVMVLETFNVNTGSILAGAGIVGLAVGFGAQNLVRDIITGFFIIFEDQFTVGEYITTAGVTGVVEELGLRTTKIREWTGQLHIIPNGEITKVTNFNRGQMLAVVEVGVAYEANLDQALEVLRRASENAAKELAAIVETPVVQGVVALRDFDVVIRVIARTVAGEQWAVERELRKRLKEALDENGIEIPYPKRVVYSETSRQ